MKLISLSKGKFTKVDNEDFENLSRFKWCITNGYASRAIYGGGKRKFVYMHREILGVKKGVEIDHENLDKLDNQKRNLRSCNKFQNSYNTKIRSHNSSGFKGVIFEKCIQRFRARIRFNKRTISLGCYPTVEEAGEAYRIAVPLFHGKFGRVT